MDKPHVQVRVKNLAHIRVQMCIDSLVLLKPRSNQMIVERRQPRTGPGEKPSNTVDVCTGFTRLLTFDRSSVRAQTYP